MKLYINKLFNTIVSALLVVAFSSCVSEIDKILDSKILKLKPINKLSKTEIIKPKLTVYKNNLIVSLSKNKNINSPESLLDRKYINANTKVTVVFFDENWPLAINNNLAKHSVSKQFIKNDRLVYVNKDFIANDIAKHEISIPLYFFHNLKAGSKTLYLGLYIESPLLNSRTVDYYSFNIKIPEIYCTRLICNGIELKNDSTFNPYNMDFSLGKNAGLPEIYWALSIPAKNENDFSSYYAKSSFQWNVIKYSNIDTFDIFSYKPDNNILISVWDFDRIFKDDFIGSWFGRLSDLEGKKTLKFNNIENFSYEINSLGIINKN